MSYKQDDIMIINLYGSWETDINTQSDFPKSMRFLNSYLNMCCNFREMPKLDTYDILITKHYAFVSSLKATLNGFTITKVGKTQGKYE